MALKRVIPCLDVDAGRVVKGTNFVGLRDAGDPVELAKREAEEPATSSPTCAAPAGWFGGTWGVYVKGGRERVDGRDAVSWAREAVARGAGEVLLTSMDRDGTNDGYDLELTRAVADAVS